MVKNPPANAGNTGDRGSITGSGRSPGVENGNPVQYSCLENSMERGAWQGTVHGVAKSRTRLSEQCPDMTLLPGGRDASPGSWGPHLSLMGPWAISEGWVMGAAPTACTSFFFLKIYFLWSIFKVFWICYYAVSASCFGFLAMRHQGWNLHVLYWKAEC